MLFTKEEGRILGVSDADGAIRLSTPFINAVCPEVVLEDHRFHWHEAGPRVLELGGGGEVWLMIQHLDTMHGGDGGHGEHDGGHGEHDGGHGEHGEHDGGHAERDGGHGGHDGGHAEHDGGHAEHDGGHAEHDGGHAEHDGGHGH